MAGRTLFILVGALLVVVGIIGVLFFRSPYWRAINRLQPGDAASRKRNATRSQ